jgi:anti-sigma regulatory factor (Ser/Thr protein kinase)
MHALATIHRTRCSVRELSGDEPHEHSGNSRQVHSSPKGPTDVSTRVETPPLLLRAHQLALKAEASAAGCSRWFVEQVGSAWNLPQERIDIAALLASELVTNAVQHAGVTEPQPVGMPTRAELPLIRIRLLELQDSFVIQVWDTSPQPPRLLTPSTDSERGRGLRLVNALSIRWGYYDTRMGGKVVWCEIAKEDL